MAKKKKKNYAVLRPALMVSCIVMGLVLVVLLSATVYAEYLLNQMNYYQETPRETMSQQEAEEFLKQETDPEDENYTGSEMNAEDVVLEGTVKSREYYGLYIKYYIDLGSQTIKVIEKNDGINIYEPGEKVTVGVHPGDVMSYPADAQ